VPEEQLTDVGSGITICRQSFGDPADPPLLLVMGLGMQMVGWHEDFCQGLANRGFHVTRYDNRDTGRSTLFDFPPPSLGQMVARRFPAEQYRLEDMADDASRLIEALELGPVHLVGASMGGMISQTLAARRPELVRSLTSIMSNTGSRITGQPALSLMRELLKRAPDDREGFIEHSVQLFTLIGTAGSDQDEIREIAAQQYDRGHDPAGAGRQLGAILKSGNRTKQLREIKAPTLVIHGKSDRLVRPSGGRATAKAIPGARFLRIDEMGHDLPRHVWGRMIEAIAANAERGEHADTGRDAAIAAA
jgi:pimeloyl-ACP methyl ester carboxylesterase